MSDAERRDTEHADRASFFPYDLGPKAAVALRPFGVRGDRDGVLLTEGLLIATFGFLHLRTPLDNIVEVSATGPYRWIKAFGARLSLADHGLTFGTSNRGVCLTFAKSIDPVIGPWNHPGVTLTVADRDAFVHAVESAQ